MSNADVILDLLANWQEMQDAGESPSAEELCDEMGHPECLEELRAAISELGPVDALLGLGLPTGKRGNHCDHGSGEIITDVVRYRVLALHGQGGMGKVYRARDEALSREVALKVLPLADGGDHLTARFLREAEITGRLEHPGIAPVYTLGTEDNGRHRYSMRFIRGKTLGDAIKELHSSFAGRRDAFAFAKELRPLLQRFVAVCQTMSYAHAQRIIHRDLKPNNIILGDYGETIVIDWGLAKEFGESDGGAPNPNNGESMKRVSDTQPGSPLGTLNFMSPEQAAGQWDQVGPPSDIYSLGATFYCLLTGCPPFSGHDRTKILELVKRGELPRAVEVNDLIPSALSEICATAMRLRAEDRYATPLALAGDLDQWLADEPVSVFKDPLPTRVRRVVRRHPRLSASVATLLLAVVAGLSGLALVQENHRRDLAEEQGRTNQQRLFAETKANEEKQQRERAEQRERQLSRVAYSARMRTAHLAWQNAQVSRVRDLLDAPYLLSDGTDLRGWEWHYLQRAMQSKSLVIAAHASPVTALAISPDGSLLASGAEDGLAAIWDVTKGETRCKLEGHLGRIHAIAFNADGDTVFTASDDTTIRIWNAVDGKLRRALTGHLLPISGIAISPVNKHIASSSEDQTIRIWDLNSGKVLHVLLGHRSPVIECSYSPNGRLLASCESNGTIRIWDAATGTEVNTFNSPGVLKGIHFITQSKYLLALESNGTATVWDLESAKVTNTYSKVERPRELKHHALMSGPIRIVAAEARTIRIWSLETGKDVFVAKGHTNEINCVAISPDGSYIASAGEDGTIRTWQMLRGSEATILSGHDVTVSSVAFSPDGKRVATASYDNTVRLWDTVSGMEILRLGESNVRRAPRRDGSQGLVQHITSGQGHRGLVLSVAFSPSGSWVASGGADKAVRVWDARSGRELFSLKVPAEVMSVSFSPDGNHLAAGAWDDKVHVWEVDSQRKRFVSKALEGHVSQIAYSPDGRLLASASRDKTVRLWDAMDGTERSVLLGHTDQVECVTFSPNGQWLASGGTDHTVRIWEVATGKTLRVFEDHTGRVGNVCFSPDGRRLACAGGSSPVRMWDVESGQEVALLAHGRGAGGVAFSRDGNLLATIGSDQSIRIWNANPLADDKVQTPPRSTAAKPLGRGIIGAALSAESDNLRILGYFIRPTLPGGLGDSSIGDVLKPEKKDHQYVVVVLSVPNGHFIPSEPEFQQMQRELAKDPTETPLVARHRVAVVSRTRFRLQVATHTYAGPLHGDWPLPDGKGAFGKVSVTHTSSERIDPSMRSMFALAWAVPTSECKGPFAVQLDQQKPVPVPALVVQVP